MRSLRIALALAVAPLVVAGGASAHHGCGTAPPMPALAFDAPKILDPVRSGGEPVVLGLPDGTIVYASHASTTLFHLRRMPDPDFVTPYTNATYVWRSTDGGDAWSYVGLAGTALGPHAPVTGWSDPDLAVDAAGNVYTAGITLATVYVARSTDSGATWIGNTAAGQATDREWLAADEAGVVYMNGNRPTDGRQLWKSTDGGLTFGLDPVSLPGGGPPSKIEVDQSDGRLYFPTGDGRVAIYPGARGDDFTRIVSDVPDGTPHTFGHIVDLAVDRAGHVYVVSNTRTEVRVSASTDRGLTWRTDVVRDASPNSVLWPSISAGADGRVGVSWFEADRPVSSSEGTRAAYRVHAAQSATAHGWTDPCGNSHDPVWEVAVATPAPFHEGVICSSGTFCQLSGVDRRLGDYHTNSITADGRLVIAYADTSFKPDSAISRPAFVRQRAGVDFLP